jgi:amino acid exporter
MTELATYIPGILLALSAVLLALMSPGPNILAVIGTSMGAGRKYGVALALGVATGSFCWALIAVSGLTALLTAYAAVLTAIKIAGGCYLIWLGYKSFRSAATIKDLRTTDLGATTKPSAYFLRGLTVQMTNPKAALAMVAIVSLGLHVSAPVWVAATLVLGITSLSLVGHLAYAFAFSTRPVVALYLKARRWIEAALGAFFCVAGAKLLSDRS